MIEVLMFDKVEKKMFAVPENWVPIMTNPIYFKAEYMKQMSRYYIQNVANVATSITIPDDGALQLGMFYVKWHKVRDGRYVVVPNTSAAKVLYGN